MILTKERFETDGIVSEPVESGKRSTTYDATVGEIISRGVVLSAPAFELKPRGVVWVTSKETFCLSRTRTGLATLKTSLTHQGLLALNVGVVDPGWNGPLATALVNISKEPIQISKGDSFFRLMVFAHEETECDEIKKSPSEYQKTIIAHSRVFAETFLDTESLSREVAQQIFHMPKIPFWIGWVSFGVAMLALFGSIAWDIFTDTNSFELRLQALEQGQSVDGLADRPAMELADGNEETPVR